MKKLNKASIKLSVLLAVLVLGLSVHGMTKNAGATFNPCYGQSFYNCYPKPTVTPTPTPDECYEDKCEEVTPTVTPTETPTATPTASQTNPGGPGDGRSDGKSDGKSDGRSSSPQPVVPSGAPATGRG